VFAILGLVGYARCVATTVAGRDVTDLTGPPMDGPGSTTLG
jgi:hypothetical protein